MSRSIHTAKNLSSSPERRRASAAFVVDEHHVRMRSHTNPAKNETEEPIPFDIGGWRIIRRLPPRPGRERFLATFEVPERDAHAAWTNVEDHVNPILERVAGGVFELHRETPDAELSMSEELALRGALRAPFRQEILDSSVCAQGRGFCVVERLDYTLAELAERVDFDEGAIVSVLAPLVELTLELHEQGRAFHGLGIADVGIESSGRPVVICFERVRELRRQDLTKVDAAVIEDWRSIAVIADQLTASVDMTFPKRLDELLEAARSGELGDTHAPALVEALFDFAPGSEIPIPDDAASGQRPPRGPAMTEPRRRREQRPAREERRVRASSSFGRLGNLVKAELRKVRKPVWIVAVASCLAGVLALCFALQEGGEPRAEAATPNVTVVSTGAPSAPGGTTSREADTSSGTSASSSPTAPPAATPGTSPSNEGGDEVRGAIECRNHAAAQRDVAALKHCFVPGAPGLEREVLRLESELLPQLPTTGWSVRDRFGDLLVLEHADASLLTLQRSGDQWLLRDVAAPSKSPQEKAA